MTAGERDDTAMDQPPTDAGDQLGIRYSGPVVARRGGGSAVDHGTADRAAALDPMLSMIERALRDDSVSLDKLERVIAIADQRRSAEAVRSFAADFAMMQAKLPVVAKGGTGHNSKKYARQEDIIRAVRPTLAEHGFAISHRIAQDGPSVRVQAVLSHRDGHSETTAMVLPPDKSGAKSEVHAAASAITYATRYTTIALLGIASSEDDDGAAAAAGEAISSGQVNALLDAFAESGRSIDRFLAYFQIEALPDLPAAQFDKALAMLRAPKREAAA